MMSPKELRDLADLIERGRAHATARVDVLPMNREDHLGLRSRLVTQFGTDETAYRALAVLDRLTKPGAK